MGSRVELFEQIRRDHDREGLSIRALAERHRVHRRTVRQALESPVPPPLKRPEGRPAPALGEYRALIDASLDAATALAVCACQQGRRVRFTTLAGLANELQEAESRRELARVVGRYARTELVVLDELGYLALPEGAAELVFQVISERNERRSLIVTTNLPFGEWIKVFPDPRLAKAVVDRLTHKAHIVDTGTESWRFRHGLGRCGKGRTA
jgi:hypothetical protein